MSIPNEKIIRKKAIIEAKKTMSALTNFELLNFEEFDSDWLISVENQLQLFRKLDSKPAFTNANKNKDEVSEWIVNSLDFLKNKKEFSVIIPNTSYPVWANVKVEDLIKGISELLKISISNELSIADKSSTIIAQIYSEEKGYEIHIGKVITDY
ncbi:hypothetical protein BpOF4_17295 [Alkalihalophilus pseudofirmus OF4]|uniref:Uncharacterized protein n=1 Tax=Alkalihalophilus pseudofirmus (strain ATCC BAA-2126 / JCM 17055 / OF4) TaxID=398511 RepID=D3FRA9_ALKPO|nr:MULTISPECIES: hypothetical protein [Alkalihalophilus]ADC51500.1 hypothetical protein BpOF4_17295 [Alkalihalophilus pseudofirmus OF4]MED1603269.1 hypothetical protein [Alkalihalophilus marmarensis]